MKRYFFFLVICVCLMAGCRDFRQVDADSFSMGKEDTNDLAASNGEGKMASVDPSFGAEAEKRTEAFSPEQAGDSETEPSQAQRQESSLTVEKGISSSAQAGSSGGDFSPALQESSPAAEIPSPLSVSPGEMVEEAWIGEDHGSWFTSSAIEDAVWERIRGVSYSEDCPLSLDELCYLRLLHWDFDGNIRVGEMIVNREIEEAVLEIFEELFESGYPIEKIRLIDEYGGDDEASMADNNTSCFNYRPIAGSSKMSAHSQGLAIDLNPLYNPYVKKRDESTLCRPAAAEAYLDRSADFPGKITKEDPAYRLFTSQGFTWGGSWKTVKDYQHFERRTKP